MNPATHRAKAQRIERSIAALDPTQFEAVIEGTMLAGTHWFNLVLHRAAILPDRNDAMHAEFLPLGTRRRVRVLLGEVLAAMDRIEALRTTHVRGDMPDGTGAAREALHALAVLRQHALREDRNGLA
ncbi:MAG TPA: hypothetical protein VFC24_07485 [Casimicrobiaceae bacterium]|nr:hypothetical protein [Casimicrobiaceae bacterium]